MDYDQISSIVEGISTEDGLSLIRAIAQKLDAITVVYTINDVLVESSEDCLPMGDWDEEDGQITEAMIQAIIDDKRWYRWIEESLSEHGAEMLPTLRLLEDGDFTVSWPY
jgi:hypothetical protein